MDGIKTIVPSRPGLSAKGQAKSLSLLCSQDVRRSFGRGGRTSHVPAESSPAEPAPMAIEVLVKGDGREPTAGLATRRKPASSSHRQAKILMRIYRSIVDADFVVKMGPGAAAADANVANDIAAVNTLADNNGKV
jgi:hypothetical protein